MKHRIIRILACLFSLSAFSFGQTWNLDTTVHSEGNAIAIAIFGGNQQCVEINYDRPGSSILGVQFCVPISKAPIHLADWGGSLFLWNDEGFVLPILHVDRGDQGVLEFMNGVH